MRFARFAGTAMLITILGGCATVAPTVQSPTVTLPVSVAVTPAPTLAESTIAPIPSVALTLPPTTLEPGPTPTAAPTPTPVPTPTPTPKPTKTPKPTPTPSPTPTPTPVDVAIYVETADIPNPWCSGTAYTIPIHVTTAGADIPNAHAKVSIPEEAFATSFDTGAIATTDTYSHDVTINVSAIGPATLTLAVKAPPGYADVNPSNNKVSITIQVVLCP